ncbi:hypothetical protein CEXT_471681 [Caerostris extrusa]|uniref:Uncharacterized protein n=1 Tax=Caerostris extrusa TaxID=172846 RepID=A0AAV4NBV7_CAEEX|nr:hypothetical protein CEXT_471681 [Caerostris extrusa]
MATSLISSQVCIQAFSTRTACCKCHTLVGLPLDEVNFDMPVEGARVVETFAADGTRGTRRATRTQVHGFHDDIAGG